MASFLYRTRGMLQFPRYVPTLIARVQASQNTPTSGSTNPAKTTSDAPPSDHKNVDLKNKSTDSSSKRLV